MASRTRLRVVAVVVVVIAAGAVALGLLPSSADDYRQVAVRSADDALSEVRTVRLAVEADLTGKTFGTYETAFFWQVRDKLSTAVSDLATQEVPDAEAGHLQAEIEPLLHGAVRAVGAAEVALDQDDAAKRAASRELDRVGDRLEAFSEANR